MRGSTTVRSSLAPEDWFSTWFDSPHYQELYASRDEAEAAAFIGRIVLRLRPETGAAMLDLGCGNGRHAARLAALGFTVRGLDLSAASIRQAKVKESPRLRFVRHDMRRPFGVGAFQYVFNLFTSFGYFADPADDLTVLHNIAEALEPGGRLVLDYLNVLLAERHLVPEETINRKGARYHLTRWTDARSLFKRIVVDLRPAEPLEYVERVAKFTLADFEFMLTVCGLTLEQAWGDYGLAPFDVERSPRLILVARKMAPR